MARKKLMIKHLFWHLMLNASQYWLLVYFVSYISQCKYARVFHRNQNVMEDFDKTTHGKYIHVNHARVRFGIRYAIQVHFVLTINNNTIVPPLTLYLPKFLTLHVRMASLPAG